jgi:uncharacterized protein YlxW (UPF0749 family)
MLEKRQRKSPRSRRESKGAQAALEAEIKEKEDKLTRAEDRVFKREESLDKKQAELDREIEGIKTRIEEIRLIKERADNLVEQRSKSLHVWPASLKSR